MIDIGFNLLAWAVLKRRNIQFVDRNLCELMDDPEPYEKLLVEKEADLIDHQAGLVSLARGMAMSRADLFSDMAGAQKWISQIIRERANDDTCISGKATVND